MTASIRRIVRFIAAAPTRLRILGAFENDPARCSGWRCYQSFSSTFFDDEPFTRPTSAFAAPPSISAAALTARYPLLAFTALATVSASVDFALAIALDCFLASLRSFASVMGSAFVILPVL